MPEGDTIHYAANRIRPVLAGHVPDELAHAASALRRAALAGAARRPRRDERRRARQAPVPALRGRPDDPLAPAHDRLLARARQPAARARAAPGSSLRRGDREVVQFKGPVLELLTESRTRFDQRLARLGPDILAPEFDDARFLRRLREDDPTRPIGDALLDQRTIAGIGNLWKVEGCFAARIDPWRPRRRVSDDEALAIVARRAARACSSPRSTASRTASAGSTAAPGSPCPRCGAPIRRARPVGGQPHDLLVPGVPA